MRVTRNVLRFVGPLALAMVGAAGCNSPAGIAVQLVGKAIDDVEAKSLGNELIGQPSAAADARLGTPMDTWREVRGQRTFRVYGVSTDVLGIQRMVVLVNRGRISSVTKAAVDSSGIDLARKMMYAQQVTGKSPAECEAALKLGPPLVTAISDKTGVMAQLYDAETIPGLTGPHYCRLRFDSSQRCTDAALIAVSASTAKDPTGG